MRLKKKTALQRLSISTHSLPALEKTDSIARKYTCAYRCANLEVEGYRKNKEYDMIPDTNVREKESIKVVGEIKK